MLTACLPGPNGQRRRYDRMLDFIGFIVIGGIAGWLAGKIMSGKGYGVIVDVILGVVGGIVGGWILGFLSGQLGHDKPQGLIVEFITALIGACILVGIVHLVRREPLRTG
jgi:uncharacterized membrane protein YeaQ/YmgE (transglycosylase-associated protein family)